MPRIVTVSSFSEIEREFIERVQKSVWCSVATVDAKNRPRSRLQHPIWEGATGWIATSRTSLKAKHLANNPYVAGVRRGWMCGTGCMRTAWPNGMTAHRASNACGSCSSQLLRHSGTIPHPAPQHRPSGLRRVGAEALARHPGRHASHQPRLDTLTHRLTPST